MKERNDLAYEQWKRELTKSIPTFKIKPKPLTDKQKDEIAEVVSEKLKERPVKNKRIMELVEMYDGIEPLSKASGIPVSCIDDIIYTGRLLRPKEKTALYKAKDDKLYEKK